MVEEKPPPPNPLPDSMNLVALSNYIVSKYKLFSAMLIALNKTSKKTDK